LVQRAVAITLDGAVVDEYVLAAVHSDEAVALFVVEPLHGALCHMHSLFWANRNHHTAWRPGSSFLVPFELRCTLAIAAIVVLRVARNAGYSRPCRKIQGLTLRRQNQGPLSLARTLDKQGFLSLKSLSN